MEIKIKSVQVLTSKLHIADKWLSVRVESRLCTPDRQISHNNKNQIPRFVPLNQGFKKTDFHKCLCNPQAPSTLSFSLWETVARDGGPSETPNIENFRAIVNEWSWLLTVIFALHLRYFTTIINGSQW